MTPEERRVLLALANAVLSLIEDRQSTGYTPLVDAVSALRADAELREMERESHTLATKDGGWGAGSDRR